MSETPANAWYHREAYDERRRTWQVSCYLSDRFPDGEVAEVQGQDDLDGAMRLWRVTTDEHGRPVIDVSEAATPGAPPVWFVGIPHPKTTPPCFDLVAFATDDLPSGTVVDNPTFTAMPIRSSNQAGAIRWFPDTAIVDQVFVTKDLRRSQLATKLVYAASAYHQHHGWAGRLHSDGRRTDLGERFVVGLRHPDRIAPWTDKAHPMDPDGTG